MKKDRSIYLSIPFPSSSPFSQDLDNRWMDEFFLGGVEKDHVSWAMQMRHSEVVEEEEERGLRGKP